jgi:hypothetical protein
MVTMVKCRHNHKARVGIYMEGVMLKCTSNYVEVLLTCSFLHSKLFKESQHREEALWDAHYN